MLFDALGTLVELEDPFTAVRRELADRGAPVSAQDARRALEAEMAYYRANHTGAVDASSLERLRDRCAQVLRDNLPSPARDLPLTELRAALMSGLRFRAFTDAGPTLDALREAGHRIAIVSNWDVSLHGVLEATGLAPRVDVVVTSAQEGVAKPDPQIFRVALQRLGGLSASDAVHVGDDVESDVGGALAAGISAVLVDRSAATPPAVARGVRVVRSLSELVTGSASAAEALS